jgi:hypothetical protein
MLEQRLIYGKDHNHISRLTDRYQPEAGKQKVSMAAAIETLAHKANR